MFTIPQELSFLFRTAFASLAKLWISPFSYIVDFSFFLELWISPFSGIQQFPRQERRAKCFLQNIQLYPVFKIQEHSLPLNLCRSWAWATCFKIQNEHNTIMNYNKKIQIFIVQIKD